MAEDALVVALQHAILRVTEGDADFFELAHTLACTTRALTAVAKLDLRFPYLIAYFSALAENSHSFFYDGIPAAVDLLHGDVPDATARSLPPQVAQHTLASVLLDRTALAIRLSRMSDKEAEKLASSYTPSDLPPGVPPRVAVFIARARGVVRALQSSPAASNFVVCENKACKQRFFRAGTSVSVSIDLGGHAVAEPSSDYWSLLVNTRPDPPPERRFCSKRCCTAFNCELDAAVPRLRGKRLDVEPDPGLEISAQARVLAGLRKAAKRNEEFARAIRGSKPSFKACTKTAYKSRLESTVRKLNLDFLLLYSSSVLSESRSLSRGLVLAGGRVRWRNRPNFVAAAARKIAVLYEKFHRDPSTVLHNLLLSSLLLQKLKEQSLSIFR
jgi:hypothetical protein